ncbi:AMP-binding protein [Propionibacterium freudenreichii]|uniref:AMP-binding protein n=1 Tax=Propionibacterium freudenreichii TaxID=1744 RepID=UPI00049FC5B2|nr:AMP-binding protein [Propionibacterium freudenreichii]AWY96491.1 long chain fatty acid-CoA ligase VraA [Propionibacterium freudenreichii]WBF60053.1 AMP-binding protein [Propionibacterium freudenreichii]WBF62118.1 AMP-binding protein [Propionibacterium freudenreichii]WBF63476.1 AMP-binding protein [Propionibacterium freudenreichii]CDP49657.1 O-succinylbenzoate-CoA ligase [Propionibacterium freudenreichii subsp. freudenreichii]
MNTSVIDTGPVCVLGEGPGVVHQFWQAHRRGRLIGLRTSGTTTGAGRVIVRSTDSWVDSLDAVAQRCALTPHDRIWIPGPMGSTMNLFAACLAVHNGVEWSSDKPECATIWQLTPARLSSLLDAGLPRSQRLREVIVAGDSLSRGLRDRATTRGINVVHYYGAAEMSMIAMGSCRDDLELFDKVEVRTTDGTIWVRSPWLAQGYLRATPDAPRQPESPAPLRRSDDGFVTVGDRGALAGRRLIVAGRDGAVTTAGQTVILAPLLDRLRHRAQGELFLLGLPHATLGQVLTAVVTRREDLGPVRAWAREHLTGGDRPRCWLWVPRPPLTASGKVDLRALALDLAGPTDGPDAP